MSSAVARLRKWIKKTEPEHVSRVYSLMRQVQLELGGVEQIKHQEIFLRAKPLIDRNISNPFEKMLYLSAAQRLFRVSQKYLDQPAKSMATAEVTLWVRRGLDATLLIAIARLFNLNVELEDVMMSAGKAKFEIIPMEGSLEIVELNTPYTIVEFEDNKVQAVEGRITVEVHGDPDRLRIVEYERLTRDGPWEVLHDREENTALLGAETVLRFEKKIEKYGYRLEITALDFAPRTIIYNFQRILLE